LARPAAVRAEPPLCEQIGEFHVVGFCRKSGAITLFIAERDPVPTIVGRVERARPGVIDGHILVALQFLARCSCPVRLPPAEGPNGTSKPRAIPGVTWVEPQFIATVKHLGKSSVGALRQPVLYELKNRRRSVINQPNLGRAEPGRGPFFSTAA
jgi:hypothetical protein